MLSIEAEKAINESFKKRQQDVVILIGKKVSDHKLNQLTAFVNEKWKGKFCGGVRVAAVGDEHCFKLHFSFRRRRKKKEKGK